MKTPTSDKAASVSVAGRTKTGKTAETKTLAVDNLDKIGQVAVYYGFAPIKSPSISKADRDAAKGVMADDFVDDETDSHGKLPLLAEEKIALIRTYHEDDWQSKPQPVCVYLKDPCRGGAGGKGAGKRYADLEIIGSSGPIAEATLIQAARAMLCEEGYESTMVEVNSVGDRDSMARFARELSSYYRKNVNDMAPECRELFKKGPFELLASHEPDCAALNAEAPRSMDFLSESSRRHLEEVLEYLEALNVPYVLNNCLIGNRSYSTETVFAITDGAAKKEPGAQRILAMGMRYNGLSKRLGMKRDIQGVGISLLVRNSVRGLRDPIHKIKRPIASFVQLGLESKLLSLDIIEKLRKVNIPLQLSLAKDRLGAQVSTVERYRTPYVIVMGKKEAVEKTAIVRRQDTYSQDIVPIEKLADYMKKAEKDYWNK